MAVEYPVGLEIHDCVSDLIIDHDRRFSQFNTEGRFIKFRFILITPSGIVFCSKFSRCELADLFQRVYNHRGKISCVGSWFAINDIFAIKYPNLMSVDTDLEVVQFRAFRDERSS